MKELRYFTSYGNPFNHYPTFIFERTTNTPAKFGVDSALYKEADIDALFVEKDYKQLNSVGKRYYFYLYCNLEEEILTIPAESIQTALSTPIKLVRERAVAVATQNGLASLKEGSVVLMLVKPKEKKTTLKAQLAILGIRIVNKMSAEVTHVLVLSLIHI